MRHRPLRSSCPRMDKKEKRREADEVERRKKRSREQEEATSADRKKEKKKTDKKEKQEKRDKKRDKEVEEKKSKKDKDKKEKKQKEKEKEKKAKSDSSESSDDEAEQKRDKKQKKEKNEKKSKKDKKEKESKKPKASEMYDPDAALSDAEEEARRAKANVPPPVAYRIATAVSQVSAPSASASTSFAVCELDRQPVSRARKTLWGANSALPAADTAKPPPMTDWSQAGFDDPQRKEKFLALMGAKKNKPAAAPSPASSEPAATLSRSEVDKMNQELERQYNAGLANRGAGRGAGLGFGNYW